MADHRKIYSAEFYPPRTPEAAAKLREVRAELALLKPAFFSVTFGAGGSTREGTLAAVQEIRAQGHEVIVPGWPGIDDRGVDDIRHNPEALKGIGLKQIVDAYEAAPKRGERHG